MSELLTTGEMVDRLKVGEVAECIEKGITEVIRDNDGIWWYDKPSGIKKSYMTLLSRNLDYKWSILPNYVSFEEAKKALKEGKTVHCHPNWNEKLSYEINPIDAENAALRYLQIKEEGLMGIVFESKWTIEED